MAKRGHYERYEQIVRLHLVPEIGHPKIVQEVLGHSQISIAMQEEVREKIDEASGG